jgi:2-polyprenyl-3-methyl-5-hydroxy-6-metoxy-1,4-benzoquinol methylase
MTNLTTQEKPYDARVCNICGSDRYRVSHHWQELKHGRETVYDVSVIQCRSCGVRRRMPGIVDNYEAEYHEPYVDQGHTIHPHQIYHFADLMTSRLTQFFEKNMKFLDVGCSTGRALRLAATIGFEATGLDFSRWATEHCAKLGFTTRHGSLIGQWQEADVFDVIHCCHTIEHVPDPLAYLREMHRLLKPKGQLMLACPNYASVPRLVLREKWIWCLDSHLWQFTARQMRSLLAATGFKVVSAKTHHGMVPLARWKKWVFDTSAALGFADGLNIIAMRR